MEAGEASYLVGKTGVEIALECIQEITGEVPSSPPGENCMRSPDYLLHNKNTYLHFFWIPYSIYHSPVSALYLLVFHSPLNCIND